MAPLRLRRRSRVTAVLLLVALLLGLVWRHPLLLERPSWIFGRPSDSRIVATLPSARGIDYRQLRDLLQRRQWREADAETQAINARLLSLRPLSPETDTVYRDILSAQGQRRASIVQSLSCTDLLTQDRLWSRASDGRFGFVAQRRITEAVSSGLPDATSLRQICLTGCLSRQGGGVDDLEVRGCLTRCERDRRVGSHEAIATRMGRALDAPTLTAAPAGHYPAPPTVVIDLADTTYRRMARRTRQCGL